MLVAQRDEVFKDHTESHLQRPVLFLFQLRSTFYRILKTLKSTALLIEAIYSLFKHRRTQYQILPAWW